jgi:hypothetical protein
MPSVINKGESLCVHELLVRFVRNTHGLDVASMLKKRSLEFLPINAVLARKFTHG